MAEDISRNRKYRISDALIRWGVFLGIAVAALFIVTLPFIIRGNYLAWSGSGKYSDGIVQHATFLEYMFRHGLFGGAGGYDYNIGLGADYMVSFSYYMMFDPINLLLYILPRGNFLLSYSIIICVRMLLCGVFMYVYLGRHSVRQSVRVIFSVAYMLAGYIVFTFARHPDLSAGAIYLPLIVLGLEQTLDKNNPFLLIVCVFLTTISSFYMAYMVTVFAVLYAALYYVRAVHLRGEKITGKKFCAVFFRTAAYYALGLLLASFLLVPVAYGYLQGARSVGKGFPVYLPRELAAMCGSFFVPVSGAKYTPVMFNAATLMLTFAAISVSPRSVYAEMSIVLSVCVFVPLAGYVMNLFNYAFNRYTYMLSFSVFALLADFFNGLPSVRSQKNKWDIPDMVPPKKQINAMVKGILAAILIMANLGAWAGVDFLFDRVHAALIAVLITVAIGCGCVSVWGFCKIRRFDFSVCKRVELLSYKRILICFMALTLAGALGFNVVYSGQFRNKERYAALQSVAESTAAAISAEEFVRLDTQICAYSDASNRPLNNGYKGTTVYNTLFSGAASEFVSNNELYTFSTTLGMSGLNGRSALQALLGVKYFRAEESAYVPMQFTATDVPELYQTDEYIPFGTVFSQTMPRAQWDALPAIERQYAMLCAVVTDDGEELPYVPFVAEAGEAVESFTLQKKHDTFEFAAPTSDNGSIYMTFEIEDFPKRETFFCVTSGKVSLEMDTSPKGGQMYTGQKKFLYKLDESADKVRFGILSGTAVTFCNIRFYTVQNDGVLGQIRAAKEQAHLTDTAFTDRGFSGKIDSQGGTMLIPLPYSEGWKATVDGKEVAVAKADGGLMGIAISSGVHTVEFAYRTPWLGAGIALTLAVAGIFVAFTGVWSTVQLVRRGKNGRQKEGAEEKNS